MAKIQHVILTGGVGSRLWPLSRQSRPKQYLKIFSEQNLFELAVKRNSPFCDELMVVGNRGNRELSAQSLQGLGMDNYLDIVEATPRNTAAAIAFAAFAAEADDVLLVTPADHIIKEGAEYSIAVGRALKLASDNTIVTFGIQPSRPETGYGYIEFEGEKVLSFREKPDAANASRFLASGKFHWNSGMFCFKAGVFLHELQKHSPVVFERALAAWHQAKNGQLEMESSLEIPSISVDYAVMEKSELIKVVPSEFEWSDMGSFESVYNYLIEQGHPVDENGNMHIGEEKFTSFVGLKNCILVSTPDANLVLSKDRSQKVKDIYQNLQKAYL